MGLTRGRWWQRGARSGVPPTPPCGARGKREESGAIPAPAPHPARDEDAFIDPRAGPKAVARARARRRARLEHQQELKRARIRFLALLGALVFLALFISLSIWETIRAVFGL